VKLLSIARDLQRRKARERQRLFVIEGVRACEEALRARLAVRGALVAPSLEDAERGQSLRALLVDHKVPLFDVTESELASAADTVTPQGVLLVAEIPDRALANLALPDQAMVLALDGLQDPGNVGTMLRTAAALGAAATLALPGTVDLWNAKVVRSAMGALFHHPAVTCTWSELDAFRTDRAIALWGADAAGDAVGDVTGDRPARLVLAVGNEGGGLSAECRARADRLVALPIADDVDSLNAAVAAGILLYTLRS
jgi:TrmH family RNA methyltransferase